MLVSYFIVCRGYTDPTALELVKTFGHHVVSDEGQQVASDSAKSAPMPESLARDARQAIDPISLRP